MNQVQSETSPGAVCGALAPDFSLFAVTPPADAPPFHLRALRHRRPVVLALLSTTDPTRNSSWLCALSAYSAELARYDVALAAVAPEAEARRLLTTVDASFPILVDEKEVVLTAYLGAAPLRPVLALVDRYSRLAALLPARDEQNIPDMQELLREISYSDQQDCACALPSWEC
jgi:hypothetical protein